MKHLPYHYGRPTENFVFIKLIKWTPGVIILIFNTHFNFKEQHIFEKNIFVILANLEIILYQRSFPFNTHDQVYI